MDVLGEEVYLVLTASAGSAQAEQAIKAFGPQCRPRARHTGVWALAVSCTSSMISDKDLYSRQPETGRSAPLQTCLVLKPQVTCNCDLI